MKVKDLIKELQEAVEGDESVNELNVELSIDTASRGMNGPLEDIYFYHLQQFVRLQG